MSSRSPNPVAVKRALTIGVAKSAPQSANMYETSRIQVRENRLLAFSL